MSGIPIIGKVFDAIKKNKILKAIVIAVVIYFTVGVALEYFAAAPSTLTGAQLSGTVFSETAAAATAEAAALGQTTVGASLFPAGVSPVAGITTAEAVGTTAIGADAAAAATAATTATTATVAGAAAETSVFGTALPEAGGTTTATATQTSTQLADVPITPKPDPTWFEQNPMSTMMLGQAGVGAVSGYMADKEQSRQDAIRAEERRSRGLFGYDYDGNYAGVVGTHLTPTGGQAQQVQAAVPPVVGTQQVMAPSVTPIQKKDLPKLNEAGQLAVG